ncbi:MAG: ABC transporter ATP-binding protein [Tissierellia bacterium]|nr:ABC transporter ATP-binding protein [Tissierellia bacterium]
MIKKRTKITYTKTLFENNRGILAMALIVRVITEICFVLVAYFMQQILKAGTEKDLDLLLLTVRNMAFFFAFTGTFILVRVYLESAFQKRALQNYKEHTMSSILKKNIRGFFHHRTGEYISTFTNDLNPIEAGYLNGIFVIPVRFVHLFTALAMMAYYNGSFTILMVALTIIPFFISVLASRKLAAKEMALSASNRNFVAYMKDLFSGFTVIKSFQAEENVHQIFLEENRELESTRYQRNLTKGRLGLMSFISSELVQTFAFLYSAYLAIQGKMEASAVIVFVQLMSYVLGPLQDLPTEVAAFHAGREIIGRAEGLTHREEDPLAIKEMTHESSIKVRNLCFSYGPGVQTLDHITHTFEKGKSYALVGPSGSGKSTLLKMLLGTFDAYEGEILYDSLSLREISLDSLYHHVSLIEQNVFVFDTNMENNITLFQPFEEEDIQVSVSRANLKEVFEAKGSESCGENGSNLSGGEKQRLSIARALIRQSSILFVDEATAALDQDTTRKIMDTILSLKNTTRIVISHNLDGDIMNKFDQILVLKEGKLVETGTYTELMEEKGLFYSMVQVEM